MKSRVRHVVAAVALLIGVWSFGRPAGAGDGHSFQLGGDVSASTTTNIGGNVQTLDWDSFFDSTGAEKPLPSGFTSSVFSKDFRTAANGSFDTSDPTTFTTGGKDKLPISTGW